MTKIKNFFLNPVYGIILFFIVFISDVFIKVSFKNGTNTIEKIWIATLLISILWMCIGLISRYKK